MTFQAVVFGVFLNWIQVFDVIVAGHKADTVCVCWKPWYVLVSPLFTRNFTWFSDRAQLCFWKTTKWDFPHFVSLAELHFAMNFHQLTLTKHRCLRSEILACKTTWSITECLQCALTDGFVIITSFPLPLSKYSILDACDIYKCDIQLKIYTNYI